MFRFPRRTPLCLAGALLASVLGCDAPEAPLPDAAEREIASAIDATPAPQQDAPAIAPPEPATKDVPEAPDTPLPPDAVKPLADLLRLPASVPAPAEESEGDPLAEAGKAAAEGDDPAATRTERTLEVQFESRIDESQLIKDRARTQTDAGVSVKTGKDTRLRGGVRVEQESGQEREAPVPTVGIEKRF